MGAMANKRAKSKHLEDRAPALADLFYEANALPPRFLFTARDPLDFGGDKALHDARQIVVEPSLEHGTKHLAGKTNDDVALLGKPAGDKRGEGGADGTVRGV